MRQTMCAAYSDKPREKLWRVAWSSNYSNKASGGCDMLYLPENLKEVPCFENITQEEVVEYFDITP